MVDVHDIVHQVSREDVRGRVRIRALQFIHPGAAQEGLRVQEVDVVRHLDCAMPHSEVMASNLCCVADLSPESDFVCYKKFEYISAET